MIVEVCANSLESALNAERAGAQRIELCAELPAGGITPSFGLIKSVKEELNIPIHVLIRPRSGDFTYSRAEFKTMLEDIAVCRDLQVDGIVSGILSSDAEVDWERTQRLIDQSGKLSFTFHRAFDWATHPMETHLRLQEMGVNNILSSGQAHTAIEGIDLLGELNAQAAECVIMPGSGINDKNALIFKSRDFKAIHLSATSIITNTPSIPALSMLSPRTMKENEVLLTDPELLKKVIEIVN
ncbi:copper homeostasis protein CutC [Muriicola soli]|uniref:PF03932 family protein CutC n=1 Tax=Muriicola soli TaxID=2507538 RepID=A0A411E6Y3_9FLAO|nr:copper homeostasis protein CutC [Muriicola soli]QBA63284.1 copper homeostasis protein CutC [Muriicola soli]